jgi:hypothetical protein
MPGRQTADDGHEALSWEPESTVDGRGYSVSDHRAELARNLPDRWEISRFEMLSPDEKNPAAGPSFGCVSSIPRRMQTSELRPTARFRTGTAGSGC